MTIEEYVDDYFVKRSKNELLDHQQILEEVKTKLNDSENADEFLIFLDDEWTNFQAQEVLENTARKARMVGIFGLIIFPLLMILAFKGILFKGYLFFIPYGLIAASIALFLIANQKTKLVIEMKRRREILIKKWG